jgi:hypothetical protein
LNEKDFTEEGLALRLYERGWADYTEEDTLFRCEVLTGLIVRGGLIVYAKDIAEFLPPSVRVLYLYDLNRLNEKTVSLRFSFAQCETLRFRINEHLDTQTNTERERKNWGAKYRRLKKDRAEARDLCEANCLDEAVADYNRQAWNNYITREIEKDQDL